jgi:Fe-S-cluster containining protein
MEAPQQSFEFACEATVAITTQLKQARTPNDFLKVQTNINSNTDLHFQRGLEESKQTLACGNCSFCCYKKVDVSPLEAFLIVDYVRKNFPAAQVEQVKAQARSNFDRIKRISDDEQKAQNIACPLLKDGGCSIYPVRPFVCRREHSMKVEDCEEVFNNPQTPLVSERLIPILTRFSNITLATAAAHQKLNLDFRCYDLSAAVFEALDQPELFRRWCDRKKPFSAEAIAKDWAKESPKIKQPVQMLIRATAGR